MLEIFLFICYNNETARNTINQSYDLFVDRNSELLQRIDMQMTDWFSIIHVEVDCVLFRKLSVRRMRIKAISLADCRM